MRKLKRLLLIGLIVFSMTGAAACGPEVSDKGNQEKAEGVTVSGQLEVSDIPEYSGEPYIEINGNEPDFDQDQITINPLRNTASWILWDGVRKRRPASGMT